jgi:hypothetical protein
MHLLVCKRWIVLVHRKWIILDLGECISDVR